MAGKRRDMAVEVEEWLMCGGGDFMVRPWGLEIEGGRGGQAGVILFFPFLGRVESYLQSYPLQSYHKQGVIFGILGPYFCYDLR